MKEGMVLPGRESAERRRKNIREQLELRVLYAEAVAAKIEEKPSVVMLRGTDLHARIFGYIPDRDTHPAQAAWWAMCAELDDLSTHEDRLGVIENYYRSYAHESKDHSKDPFWPFRYDPPSADGAVELHFGSMNLSDTPADGPGLLSSERYEKMISQLTKMFTEIKGLPMPSRTVRGASWLYNREEYRRLYPESFTKHPVPRESGEFVGGGTWGQFRKSDGSVDTELRAQFVENLKNIDLNDLHKVFPIETLMVEGPIEDFYKKYGIE